MGWKSAHLGETGDFGKLAKLMNRDLAVAVGVKGGDQVGVRHRNLDSRALLPVAHHLFHPLTHLCDQVAAIARVEQPERRVEARHVRRLIDVSAVGALADRLLDVRTLGDELAVEL